MRHICSHNFVIFSALPTPSASGKLYIAACMLGNAAMVEGKPITIIPTLPAVVRKRLTITVDSVDLASLPILPPYAKRKDENGHTL
jgi:hypothetical protein